MQKFFLYLLSIAPEVGPHPSSAGDKTQSLLLGTFDDTEDEAIDNIFPTKIVLFLFLFRFFFLFLFLSLLSHDYDVESKCVCVAFVVCAFSVSTTWSGVGS